MTTLTTSQSSAYRAEQDRKTLVCGRVFGWLVGVTTWYFLYQDLAILQLGLWVIGWRLMMVLPAISFVWLSYTIFRRDARHVLWAHLCQEFILIVAVCGYIFSMFSAPEANASNIHGSIGALMGCTVAVGALAARARRWLGFIYGLPLAGLIGALLLWSDQTGEQIALLTNPIILSIAMVIIMRVHEHLSRREFDMRWLANQQKTELEAYAEQLKVVNRDLEHFAGITSHELQQPLVTVNWWLGLASSHLKDRALLSGLLEDYLTNAEATVSHMNGLIARLLTYSGLNEDELLRESTDLNTVFSHVVGDLEALITTSGAAVTADRLPVIEADRYLLGEVLQNLVENAIKYAHPERPPTVHVSAEESAHGWRITVKDNGRGIDPAGVDTIFAPQGRLRAADSERGAGLGLATCRKIVHLHGGTIGVVPSESGCSFWFTLPKQSR